MRNETPDSWIERRPEDGALDPEDCCPVCGVYDDCVCPDDTEMYVCAFIWDWNSSPPKCYQCGELESDH
jgi:hypothetical protein